jgi:uncharacterized Rossmann fold enzyme
MQEQVGSGGATPRTFKTVPFFTGGANVECNVLMDHWRLACKLDLPWVSFAGKPRKEQLCIVGGGPSLKDTLDGIRFRKSQGGKIWCLNNSWRVLHKAGIKFDAIVMMDARPENVAFLEGAPDCQFYIAAICHPSVFEALKGKNVTLWHPHQGNEGEQACMEAERKEGVLLPGGGTVGLRAMFLAHALGFRKLHLYGMDSSYRDNDHHAYEQALNDGETVKEMKMEQSDRIYRCSVWMMRQADEFRWHWTRLVAAGCTVTAHGDGLLPDLCRIINKRRAEGIKLYERRSQDVHGPRGQARTA